MTTMTPWQTVSKIVIMLSYIIRIIWCDFNYLFKNIYSHM